MRASLFPRMGNTLLFPCPGTSLSLTPQEQVEPGVHCVGERPVETRSHFF